MKEPRLCLIARLRVSVRRKRKPVFFCILYMCIFLVYSVHIIIYINQHYPLPSYIHSTTFSCYFSILFGVNLPHSLDDGPAGDGERYAGHRPDGQGDPHGKFC